MALPDETTEKRENASEVLGLDSTMDDQLGVILDAYLAECDAGTAPPREEFLAQHPALADRLAGCLDAVDMMETGDAVPLETSPRTIGDYELLGEIGRGGMGVVYEARERTLNRIVALKVMRFGIVDPQALERFQREAETAGGLHHTNIVPVYATGREGDTSWYAMQRIEGDSLNSKIKNARESGNGLTEKDVTAIGIQAAEALAHAHERGVIHRDVKPANLIVESEGRVWLTDFGLARRLIDVGATITGTMMGTPRYMSPEQASLTGATVDHRSDIYSLGATLYQSVTGQPPVTGDDPLEVITQIREDDPPSVRTLRPEISRDLDVVILKAMSKSVSDRYQNTSEFLDDLRAVHEGRPIRARGLSLRERMQRWSRKNETRVRLISTAVAATIVGVFCLFVAWNAYRESRQGEFLLRASGGPFTARFFAIDDENRRELVTSLTVPMEQAQQLEAGDYDVQLAPTGRWSSLVRMPVQRGGYRDFRLRRDPEKRREVSIEDASAIPIMGFNAPAVLHTKGPLMSRMTIDPSQDWTLFVSAVQTEVTWLPTLEKGLDTATISQQMLPTTVDFGFDNSRRTDWVYDRLYADTTQANPSRVLRSPIDLDGDGRSETIVAADRDPALMAIDADGKMLWARRFDFGRSKVTNLRSKLQLPGVISIVNVGDVNDDLVDDLVVSLVRVQPMIQTDTALAWISGRDGKTLRARRMPPIAGALHKAWPLDGGLRFLTPRTRKESNIAFGMDGAAQVSFSRSRQLEYSRTSSNTATTGFALPSPLGFLPKSNSLIFLAGKTYHRIDSKTGTLLGEPLELPSMPERLPQAIQVGNKTRLLFEGVHHPNQS
ncbi:MAG: serine/threonine-protein kinase, partial [Planctomycetota bacterium]